MVAKLISVLSALGAAGIRARRGTLNEKAILPESPVAVAYPERSAADALTIAVEVFGGNAVDCENLAYEAADVLNGLRASCTVEKCQYSGRTGLFSLKVLAQWPAELVQRVYLDDQLMTDLTDFRAEATSEAYLSDTGESTQTDWTWTLTLEELLSEGKAPESEWTGTHTVKVVTAGGTEIYSNGCWTSVCREGDSRGTVQKRTLKCWSRTVE